LAVSKDDRADIAHTLAVHQHAAGRIAPEDARARPGYLEPEAILHEKDAIRGNPDALREPSVLEQVTVLTVHGHEVARPGERQHLLQIVLARMAGDVDEGHVLPQDLRPPAQEGVDRTADHTLVARDHARGEDHQIARLGLDVLVLAG